MSGIKVEPWCDDKCLLPKVTNHESSEINLSKYNWVLKSGNQPLQK